MANINLVTSESKQQADEEQKERMISNGLVAAVFFLIATLALYGGMVFLKMNTEKNISQTKSEYEALYQELKKSNAKDVVDFQTRLGVANELVLKETDSNTYLRAVEKAMVSGVYLDEYKYDEATKTIALKCAGDNYNMIARQILSFKKGSCFSNVKVKDTVYNTESNKITLPLEITINTLNAPGCE